MTRKIILHIYLCTFNVYLQCIITVIKFMDKTYIGEFQGRYGAEFCYFRTSTSQKFGFVVALHFKESISRHPFQSFPSSTLSIKKGNAALVLSRSTSIHRFDICVENSELFVKCISSLMFTSFFDYFFMLCS